ncbi:hypothetical protein H1P_910004 [Hyella patelloides LEGE 07179]|uniref:Uncharacterized protein n=1 Tax=Hyella patelloides LEGE 07179 TaxID=945734 RepID=A0A563W540_9CYAN|nr:hypothetical protein H1P_910004 [Hyella patelloides LEGE 07179]
MLVFNQRKELGFNKRYSEHMNNTLKPIFTSSIYKWKQKLSNTQIAIIQSILDDDMKLMEYSAIDVQAVLPQVRYKIDDR